MSHDLQDTKVKETDNNKTREQEIVVDISSTKEPETIDRKRETVRGKIAIYMTYALVAMSMFTLATIAAFPDRVSALKEIVPIIFTGVFGVYGTIIGFYFGEKS